MVGVKRFFVSLSTILLCFFLQFVIFPRIRALIAVPNLMLVAAVSLGFLYGKANGLCCGVVSGLLMDVLGSGIPGFYTLILAVLGYVNGMLSEKIESEMILLLFLFFSVNEMVYHGYVYALSFLIRKSFVLSTYINSVVLPELMLSLICFLVIYGILVFISKRWDLRVNKGEIRIV